MGCEGSGGGKMKTTVLEQQQQNRVLFYCSLGNTVLASGCHSLGTHLPKEALRVALNGPKKES